ncbi:MAG TPA: hypothetical protein VFR32_06435 [Gaiellaceae bacterium]|nr:hypothetical protein [Gaiellaceae bacterium]
MRTVTWLTVAVSGALVFAAAAASGPTAPPLSNARLAGDFDVMTKVTAASGIDTRRGATDTGTWTFTPTCPSGACNARLRIEYGRFLVTDHVARITLKKAGPVYKGSTTTPLVECNFKDVPGVMTVRLEVTKGEWINGKWRAARVVGKYDYDAPATTSGIFRCSAAHLTSTVRGTLED